MVKQSLIKTLQKFDNAFSAAFVKTQGFITTNLLKDIAWGIYLPNDPDFGTDHTLRTGWFNAYELNKNLTRDPETFWVEMRFNMTRFADSVFKKSSGEHYGLIHMFEISGWTRYQDPSTVGTKPIQQNEKWNKTINFLLTEFRNELLLRGFDI